MKLKSFVNIVAPIISFLEGKGEVLGQGVLNSEFVQADVVGRGPKGVFGDLNTGASGVYVILAGSTKIGIKWTKQIFS